MIIYNNDFKIRIGLNFEVIEDVGNMLRFVSGGYDDRNSLANSRLYVVFVGLQPHYGVNPPDNEYDV